MNEFKNSALGLNTKVRDGGSWRGRFPYNEIISLLDVNRPFNLAESTSQDLTVGEVIELVGFEALRDLKLGYGSCQAICRQKRSAQRGFLGIGADSGVSGLR